jgi:hypothetical protein
MSRKLTISGLSSALKAQKRSELTQKLGAIVDVHVETELRIGRESKDRRNLSISASSVDFYVGLP